MIRAIILDLGQVVVPFDLSLGYQALAPHCPFPASELQARVAANGLVAQFETGQIETDDFLDRLAAQLGIRIGRDVLRDIWTGIFLPGTLIPEETLAAVRRRYRLLALSNTNALHFSVVQERYPALAHFDDLILSHQVGHAKPSPRIYEVAVERAGCRPGECLFADDCPSYIEGALRAGMQAFQFENAAQWERELAARGVNWKK